MQIPSMSPTPKISQKNNNNGEKFEQQIFQEQKQQAELVSSGDESSKKKPLPSPRLKRMEFVREPTPEDIAALGTHAPVLDKIEDARKVLNSLSDQLTTPVNTFEDWEKRTKVELFLKLNENFFVFWEISFFFPGLRRIFG